LQTPQSDRARRYLSSLFYSLRVFTFGASAHAQIDGQVPVIGKLSGSDSQAFSGKLESIGWTNLLKGEHVQVTTDIF